MYSIQEAARRTAAGACSTGAKAASTNSAGSASGGQGPMPIRSRGKSVVPSVLATDWSPRWPLDEPRYLNLKTPEGKSRSSTTTRISVGSSRPSRRATWRTGGPLRFINFSGFASTTLYGPPPAVAAPFLNLRLNLNPQRCASSSTTRKPKL